MGGITAYAIANSRLTIFLVAAVIFAGLVTYVTQPSQEDPEVTIRTALVTTQFPGMSAERIEQLITRPIESSVKQIPEVKTIETQSMTGLSLVKVTVHDRYFDLDPIWSDLRNRMGDLEGDLPEGTRGPTVNDDYGSVAVATLALTGADFTAAELRRVARDLRDDLGVLPLVSRIDLHGVQEERIWLDVDPDVMANFGITAAQVVSAIRQQNIILPGGSLTAEGLSIVIEPSGNFESIDEINEVTIEVPESGGIVYLRDLVGVRRGTVDPARQPALFNGAPAVVLAVAMISNVNIVEFGRQLDARLAPLIAALPLGMSLSFVTNQPPLVEASLANATNNLYQTLAIVLIVVMLFLGPRVGLIVGGIVPLAIFAALVGMNIWGIPLHRISIAAIIIALGLLVDNGIVVAEDIQRRLAQGEARLHACVEAGRSLGTPLLTSSLTTILAFMPLMLAENTAAEFVGPLAQVILLTLLSSWFLSITVAPALCYWFLRSPGGPGASGSGNKVSYDGWAYTFYRRVLSALLRARLLFVLGMVALLALAVYGLGFVTPRLMPSSERAQFVVNIELPAGSDITETQRVAGRFAAWLGDPAANPEVEREIIYIGSGGPRFFLALQPVDAVPHVAFAVINTRSSSDVEPLMARVERFFAEQVPEARARAEKLFLGSTPPGTVSLRVFGPEIPELRRIAGEIEAVYRSVPGAANIRDDWGNPVIKSNVNIDQARARRAGVTSEEIAETLSAYFDGVAVTDYREGDTVIPVVFRARAAERGDFDKLRSLTVYSQARGVPVPLIQIADFDGEVEPFRIVRNNQRRAIMISAIHPRMQASELYAAIQPALDGLNLPFGYSIEPEGEIKDSKEANGALFQYMPHCLAGIVLLLIWQFNSFRRPLIVGLTIPLVLIGATAGLLATGAFLDFVAMLGLFSLAGIIINNGIVLIDRIDLERGAGKGVDEAIVHSSLTRFRPILMTTLTTILGLLPLHLFGGEFWYAMTVVIMSGLAVGTVLTLGVVPVLYSLLLDFRHRA